MPTVNSISTPRRAAQRNCSGPAAIVRAGCCAALLGSQILCLPPPTFAAEVPAPNTVEAGAALPASGNTLSPLPLYFERNVGQWGADTRFACRGRGGSLLLSDDGAVLLPAGMPVGPRTSTRSTADLGVRIRVQGARPNVALRGERRSRAEINYLLGSDPAHWRTDVPAYEQVRGPGVLPGIDLVYHARGGALEYDFVLKPGTAPASIQLKIEGADDFRIDPQGNLRIRRGAATFIHKRPVAYQDAGGRRRTVSASFTRRKSGRIGFVVGRYDHRLPLTIDPVLVFSSYFGGEAPDQPNAVAVDGAGNAYVVGSTRSTRFPTFAPAQPANAGMYDIFVAKLNPARSALAFCTYLGGSSDDFGQAIALTREGRIVVAGTADSRDFPRRDSVQKLHGGGKSDAFVATLSPTGRELLFSSLLGKAGDDSAQGVAVNSEGKIYLAGTTGSTDLPAAGMAQATHGGGTLDAFVAKLEPRSLTFLTYLGGSGEDRATALRITADGKAWIGGATTSPPPASPPQAGAFPTKSPLFPNVPSDANGFVARVKEDGKELEFSTLVGGTGADEVAGLALDPSGGVYLTGTAAGSDFPCNSSLFPYRGGLEAFVMKLSSDATAVLYATFLGGTNNDHGRSIAVDNQGTAFVTGETNSGGFPLANPLQSGPHGGYEAFVTAVHRTGASLEYSSYLGGIGHDRGLGIAVTPGRRALVVGETNSRDAADTGADEGFPLANPLQSLIVGETMDGFMVDISPQILGRLSVPRSVGFGTVKLGAPPAIRKLRLRNTGKSTVTITIGNPVSPFSFDVPPGVIHLHPGAGYPLMVRFDPLAPGSYKGTITLNVADPNPRRVEVRLTGRVPRPPAAR